MAHSNEYPNEHSIEHLMAGPKAHPMDDFPVRPLKFELDSIEDEELVWSESSPEFSMFINALGLHVPYFERFLVATMREYRDALTDDALRQDVQRIIGQEAHHAFNFVKWNARMGQSYPGIAAVDAQAQAYFDKKVRTGSRQFKIGFTAGYETFTFLAGIIILDRFDELMGQAQPNMRALWVWHQVEEVEHGAVAFDFYKAFYAHKEWYRKSMVLFAFAHIALETFKAYRCIVKVERTSAWGKMKAWRFFAGFAWDLFSASLPVLRKDYHPRRHPICNAQQNRVAVAWRRYTAEGGDPLQLDQQAIAKMLAI